MDNKNEQTTEKPKGNILQNENRSDEENPVEDTNVKTGNNVDEKEAENTAETTQK